VRTWSAVGSGRRFAARVAELKEAAAAASGIAAQRILEETAKLAFANMFDFVSIDRKGLPHVDLSNVSRDQAAALTELVVDEFVDDSGEAARPVRRVRFKLADKLGALTKLGQHLGLFKDRVRLEGKVEVESKPLTDLEAARQIAFLLETAARAAAVIDKEMDAQAPERENTK
jgi:phage terminase small subunit